MISKFWINGDEHHASATQKRPQSVSNLAELKKTQNILMFASLRVCCTVHFGWKMKLKARESVCKMHTAFASSHIAVCLFTSNLPYRRRTTLCCEQGAVFIQSTRSERKYEKTFWWQVLGRFGVVHPEVLTDFGPFAISCLRGCWSILATPVWAEFTPAKRLCFDYHLSFMQRWE